MAIESKDILDYLGVDPSKVNSIDDFKTLHDTDFIKKSNIGADRELHGKIVGARVGTIQTALTKALKSYGVELKAEDLEGKKVEDIIELGLKGYADLSIKAQDELKAQIGSKPSEQLTALQTKYESLERKYNETEGLRKDLQTTLESTKTDYEGKLKGVKLDTLRNQSMGKVKFKQGMTDLEREGFNAIITKKYKTDLDGDNIFVTDDKGERIKSTKKAGEFKTFDEVLEEEAAGAKLLAIANNKPNVTPPARTFTAAPQTTGTEQNFNQRQVAPAAARAAGMA